MLVAGVLALTGCGHSASVAQRAIDAYVPGVAIGDLLPRATRLNLRLQVAPYVGYGTTAFSGPDAFSELWIRVRDPVQTDAAVPPPYTSPVTSVQLVAHSHEALNRAIARLQKLLGAPSETCYAGPPSEAHIRSLYWAGIEPDDGALLVAPRDGWSDSSTVMLTLGAKRPSDDPVALRTEPCSARGAG